MNKKKLKEVSLKFRVTQNEKELIETRSKIYKKSFSEFARFMLINGEVIIISDQEKRILAGLANNINQLTKLFHQKNVAPTELLIELHKLLIHLKNAYRRSS